MAAMKEKLAGKAALALMNEKAIQVGLNFTVV